MIVVMIVAMAWTTFSFLSQDIDSKVINSADDLKGAKVGLLIGASYNVLINSRYPDNDYKYYTTYNEMIQDLNAGRIDCYIVDEPMAKAQVREAGGIRIVEGHLTKADYGLVLAKSNTKLRDELSLEIDKLKADGTLDGLAEKWIDIGGMHYLEYDEPDPSEAKGTLRVATNADSAPFSYNYSGQIIGYDVEVLGIAAAKLGYRIETTQYAYGSLINSITTGQEDVAVGGITYTEEKSKSVIFTSSVYHDGTVIVVQDKATDKGLVKSTKDAINRMLIMENRWKLVAAGIGVTIMISLATLVLGSLLGLLFSMLMRSESRRLSRFANGINTVVGTLPLLIILMILYYVIFAKSNISAFTIAIIGMTIVFSNTVAGIIDTGFLAIDKGQLEAAEAMGYRKRQVFLKIAFPQILRQMYTQYEGAVMTMIKDTSIVGYITVQDLTNVSDTIRAMTYQAFFPLLFTAVIYFLIAELIVKLLQLAMKRIRVGGAK